MCDCCPAVCSSSSSSSSSCHYYYYNLLPTPDIDTLLASLLASLPPCLPLFSLCLSCRSSHLPACMRRRSMAILSVVGSVKHAIVRLASATADDTNKAINTTHAHTFVSVMPEDERAHSRRHAPMHCPHVQTPSQTHCESSALRTWRSRSKCTTSYVLYLTVRLRSRSWNTTRDSRSSAWWGRYPKMAATSMCRWPTRMARW